MRCIGYCSLLNLYSQSVFSFYRIPCFTETSLISFVLLINFIIIGETFAFVSGPIRWSRFLTPVFELPEPAVFNFDYRTALTNTTIATFTVFVKRNDTIIETILSIVSTFSVLSDRELKFQPSLFSDPTPTSWRNASALLLGGAYEYVRQCKSNFIFI